MEPRDRERSRRRDDHLFLPQDVLTDHILLKLPVKSLMKLRCVSKYFKNLITSPSFVYQHLHHSTSQPNNHLVVISTNPASYKTEVDLRRRFNSCKFGDDPLRPEVVNIRCPFDNIVLKFDNLGKFISNRKHVAYILASCNGLLYMSVGDDKYICNPCTKEYKMIPMPPLEYKSSFRKGFCGFGYDSTNDEYKTLYYKCYESTATTYIEEFTLYTPGTDTWRSISNVGTNTWRRICKVDSDRDSSLSFGRWTEVGLLLNGALHWIMLSKPNLVANKTISFDIKEVNFRELRKQFKQQCVAKIISFDIEKEEFREIQKPQSVLEIDEFYWDLQVLQGCLCMCQDGDFGLDIWMLKDYAVQDSWTKLFTIVNPKPHLKEVVRDVELNLFSRYDFHLLRFYENGEILMAKDGYHLVVYDPVKSKARPVENSEAFKRSFTYQTTYVESLVSLNTGLFRGCEISSEMKKDYRKRERFLIKLICSS